MGIEQGEGKRMPRRVLITGANGGIGRCLATGFAAAGYQVLAAARRPEMLDEVTCDERIGLDVTDQASVDDAIGKAGRIDVLINNAGTGAGGPTEAVPIDAARGVFEVNLFGAARLIRAVLPQMRARGDGTLVAISSMSARLPWAFGAYYAASKAALAALHEAVELEVAGFGIRTIIIEPGIVDTAFAERFATYGSEAVAYLDRATTWGQQFLGTHTPAEAVADAVVTHVRSDAGALAHVPVGDEATEVLATRDRLPAEQFLGWFAERHQLPLAETGRSS